VQAPAPRTCASTSCPSRRNPRCANRSAFMSTHGSPPTEASPTSTRRDRALGRDADASAAHRLRDPGHRVPAPRLRPPGCDRPIAGGGARVDEV